MNINNSVGLYGPRWPSAAATPLSRRATVSQNTSRWQNRIVEVLTRTFTLSTLAAVLLSVSCGKKAESPAVETAREPESRVSKATTGEILVTVTAESQALAGIKTEPLKESNQKPTSKAFGRVLDPSTLGPLYADVATASATADASAAELQRLETLATQNNASARTVEAGRAAAARDKALLQAAQIKLVSAWGTALTTNSDLPKLINELAAQKALLIQLNMELGQTISPGSQNVALTSAAGGTNQMESHILGPAPSVDAQAQGRALLLLSENNGLQLGPGSTVVGVFETTGAGHKGVVFPESAVVHHNGALWVYVQVAPDKFERKRLVNAHPDASVFFVEDGFRGGEQVVSTGAQVLLSEELKSTESTAE